MAGSTSSARPSWTQFRQHHGAPTRAGAISRMHLHPRPMTAAPALARFRRNSTGASQRWRSSDFLPEEQVEDDDEKNDSADAKIHFSLPGWIAFGRENDWGIVRLRCASPTKLGIAGTLPCELASADGGRAARPDRAGRPPGKADCRCSPAVYQSGAGHIRVDRRCALGADRCVSGSKLQCIERRDTANARGQFVGLAGKPRACATVEAIVSWSAATLPISPKPEPSSVRLKLSPLTRSMARLPAPIRRGVRQIVRSDADLDRSGVLARIAAPGGIGLNDQRVAADLDHHPVERGRRAGRPSRTAQRRSRD